MTNKEPVISAMVEYAKELEERAANLNTEVDQSRLQGGSRAIPYTDADRRRNLVKRNRATVYAEVARDITILNKLNLNETIETQIAEYIESMFLRPAMYAINGHALEMTILTAMQCWAMSVEFDSKRLRTLWREQVPIAFPNAPHGYATISLGLGPDKEESQKVVMKRVVEHMKILWGKIKT